MVSKNYGWIAGNSGTILQYINKGSTVDLRAADEEIPSSIFPNPSSENSTIKFELKKGGNTIIELFNQQGYKIASYNLGMLAAGKFSKTIPVSSLQDGIYYYKIISSGVKGDGKFIKIH